MTLEMGNQFFVIHAYYHRQAIWKTIMRKHKKYSKKMTNCINKYEKSITIQVWMENDLRTMAFSKTVKLPLFFFIE